MGILSQLERRQRLENPQVPLSSANITEALGLGETTPAGVTINATKALGLSAFWAGVRMISQTIACLPLAVYERQPQGRRLAENHPVHRLLAVRPNPYMPPFNLKELISLHLLVQGNAYLEIPRGGRGYATALWPLLPNMTSPQLANGHKRYQTSINNAEIWLGEGEVLHIPGMGWDGVQGYNVVHVHRDTLGLTSAANEYGSRFFGNSGRPSGYIEHPAKPGVDERAQLRDEWNAVHGGLSNAQRTAVLWGGMKWHPVSLPPEDAQFLQTRSHQIEEVARILNINPILLQHHEKATTWGSGVAQFLIAFAKFTVIPWLERIEDSMNLALFPESEQGRFYVKFNSAALLRGDLEMQAKILEIKRRNGVINADEWRALDDDNPLPDGLGTHYMMPLNMAPIQTLLDDPRDDNQYRQQAKAERRSATVTRRQRDAHRSLFEDGARRFVRRDVDNLKRAVERAFESGNPTAELNRWIEEFYPGQRRVILQTMTPIVAALAETVGSDISESLDTPVSPEDMDVFAKEYTETLAQREVSSSIGQVRTIMDEAPAEELRDSLTMRATEWSETRPGKVAGREVVAVASGAVRKVAQTANRKLVWRANPGACPLCQQMDGRVISSTEYFVGEGDAVSAEGTAPLRTETNIGGPPLHAGCDCTVEVI